MPEMETWSEACKANGPPLCALSCSGPNFGVFSKNEILTLFTLHILIIVINIYARNTKIEGEIKSLWHMLY